MGADPVPDLVLHFSQWGKAIPTYSVGYEQILERAAKNQVEEYITTRFAPDQRGFIRIRIDKATHGPRTRDEVATMAEDLARWGQTLGFSHGEICIDVGYMDLQNPRAIIRDW